MREREREKKKHEKEKLTNFKPGEQWNKKQWKINERWEDEINNR